MLSSCPSENPDLLIFTPMREASSGTSPPLISRISKNESSLSATPSPAMQRCRTASSMLTAPSPCAPGRRALSLQRTTGNASEIRSTATTRPSAASSTALSGRNGSSRDSERFSMVGRAPLWVMPPLLLSASAGAAAAAGIDRFSPGTPERPRALSGGASAGGSFPSPRDGIATLLVPPPPPKPPRPRDGTPGGAVRADGASSPPGPSPPPCPSLPMSLLSYSDDS
mmetsp:Transcript_60049/g.190760  ORF Transcript_60049/g.190760 Transcript_60049/m.190760 type:complete len:226 (+) Transcript_60049:435-1112(+)